MSAHLIVGAVGVAIPGCLDDPPEFPEGLAQPAWLAKHEGLEADDVVVRVVDHPGEAWIGGKPEEKAVELDVGRGVGCAVASRHLPCQLLAEHLEPPDVLVTQMPRVSAAGIAPPGRPGRRRRPQPP